MQRPHDQVRCRGQSRGASARGGRGSGRGERQAHRSTCDETTTWAAGRRAVAPLTEHEDQAGRGQHDADQQDCQRVGSDCGKAARRRSYRPRAGFRCVTQPEPMDHATGLLPLHANAPVLEVSIGAAIVAWLFGRSGTPGTTCTQQEAEQEDTRRDRQRNDWRATREREQAGRG